MASFADRVKVLIDVDSTNAVSGISKFKSSFAEAEGAVGKFKVAGGAAMDYIKANAGMMAAGAGTAIAGFVMNAVGQFQDLALAVSKFRDATGLSLDQASRWTEVAGDIGVSSESIQTALNKMNKAASSGSGLFKELGVELQKHKDGTYDPEATFMRVLDALNKTSDSADKAKIASGLLGKGWMDMAELIAMGSDKLETALGKVSGAKIIDQSDVDKAKDYRAKVDDLKDSWEEFSLTIGEKAIPAVTALLEEVNKLAKPLEIGFDVGIKGAGFLLDALNPLDTAMNGIRRISDSSASVWERGYGAIQLLGGAIPGVNNLLDDFGGFLFGSKKNADSATQATDSLWKSIVVLNDETQDAIDANERLAEQMNLVDEAFATLEGHINERDAIRNLQDAFTAAGDAAWKAFMEKTPEAIKQSEKSLDRVRLLTADYVSQLDDIPADKKTKIIASLDSANIQEIEKMIAQLTRDRTIRVLMSRPGEIGSGGYETGAPRGGWESAVTPYGTFYRQPGGEWTATPPGRAAGGPVTANTPYIVGERGPELFIPNQGGRINPNIGSNITINVAGSVSTERDLIEAIRIGLINAQKSGKQLIYSNT